MITPDEIIRSARKTLSVSVDCFGKVTVRAPRRLDEKRILAFLQEKESWIIKQKRKTAVAGICLPPENLLGYEFLLLGEKHKIAAISGVRVSYDNENKTLVLPAKNPKDRLVKWLKENALRIFCEITERRAKEMGVAVQSVKITSARRKWGSCSGKDEIRYSFRLLYAPKEVIDYVVVHELAHVRHKNHSAAFWNEVARFVPDYKTKRQWLKARAALAHVF
ncbi:MAG: M48 family metallopeptidase [Clostridia bacterium]|nr:M48 family metallopeptidase [Clostridia bacterium]